ncbi:hypothetical protein LX64_00498 [Chitinophaga skermanii]|uniref:TraB family protein n=1 Tax=Chitinophaga skermanii TaxID=331697 RepID=A0A327R2N7_9BACT|nr:DUF5694 domain-containing protein [Chitinophaga skermanii]RAJ10891.1 hypothetical protein LX64_00498 [Chitinophaga skermanii]
MRKIFTLLLLCTAVLGYGQQKINVILIGTYHFNNPGFDQNKVIERNILEEKNQQSLESISDKIVKKYKPSKVFVEYPFDENEELNQLFSLYKAGKPIVNVDTLKNNFLKRFYSENEIFQFGFRIAKKANNDSIYAMDYDNVPMYFNKIKSKVDSLANFTYEDFMKTNMALADATNKIVGSSKLEHVFRGLNSAAYYKINLGSYIWPINLINKDHDFFGSDLVAAWYKRNLIMYSNIQRATTEKDATIVILAGAGHASIMASFIQHDARFNLISIDKVL